MMSKTNEQLEGLYKQGLPISHLQGLREVYQVGRADEQEAQSIRLKGLEDRLGDQDKAHQVALATQAAQHKKTLDQIEQDKQDAQEKARKDFPLQPGPEGALASGQAQPSDEAKGANQGGMAAATESNTQT